ncbi:MAG TPA: formylglycine-generating enzyme family protein [Leptospiraceae bacterium]|nr:formylglycine-generating enzyme family protein [Leptospiraceae bacterium]HMW06383.1 formylglycine-generating enzyme family protein [Leptospiraceae bacterium]HMX31705.1 formylglycine-generating enzyme family protein [Leptospiraceae bacterium]HMY31991.1 formylglycine-generating enzyme family protein [Leptospiraceae bacterium]HMZ65796.1 formylglycine-generating enzyme family protein [Leptospiraceae bacterium]
MKNILQFILILAIFLSFALSASYFIYKQEKENKLIFVKGGTFTRGRIVTKRPDESPVHRVEVSSFYYQETLVTQRQYKEFTKQSGYITTAETKGACLISVEGMKDWEWFEKKGANYLHPFGIDSEIEVNEDYPVVCLSYLDAKAYCEYYQMRLPTEAEWEYAARAGSKERFPWGESPTFNGKYMLNFWQGEDHKNANSKDGNKYLSKVKAYPPNVWGIYDAVGNVWQFTDDFYDPLTYLQASEMEKETGKPIKDPKGPLDGNKKVTRGGSWWCSEKTCNGYGLYFRGKVFTYSAFNNNGFRCVKDNNN